MTDVCPVCSEGTLRIDNPRTALVAVCDVCGESTEIYD